MTLPIQVSKDLLGHSRRQLINSLSSKTVWLLLMSIDEASLTLHMPQSKFTNYSQTLTLERRCSTTLLSSLLTSTQSTKLLPSGDTMMLTIILTHPPRTHDNTSADGQGETLEDVEHATCPSKRLADAAFPHTTANGGHSSTDESFYPWKDDPENLATLDPLITKTLTFQANYLLNVNMPRMTYSSM